jgi:uncharacterized protein YodC (DUF2158 family)
MTIAGFKESLSNDYPSAGLSLYLQALWYDGKGNWKEAHTIIQDIEDKTAAWIHAYLHRKEGDSWNADYWYNRAGRKRPAISSEQEWESIAVELLINNF